MMRLEGVRCAVDEFSLGPIDLDLAGGEILVVLGPSGAGKSTLLDVIAGFRRPDAGQVFLAGAPANDIPPHERRTGWVSQADTMFPHLSVHANLSYGLRRRKLASPAIEEAVRLVAERTGITSLLNRDSHALSGGERQRVAFARAVVTEPQILLCDEPFSALDRGRRLHLQQLLLRVQQEQGFSLVHVTHDIEEARTLGGQAAVIVAGQLVKCGPLSAVLEDPGSRAAAEALGVAAQG